MSKVILLLEVKVDHAENVVNKQTWKVVGSQRRAKPAGLNEKVDFNSHFLYFLTKERCSTVINVLDFILYLSIYRSRRKYVMMCDI